jgi:transposase
MLALTILLETGTRARLTSVGDLASDCRCVKSQRLSHGQVTGQGHPKNGYKYLSGAFVEAPHVAIRFDPGITRCYQRKQAKSHQLVALKAVTHT